MKLVCLVISLCLAAIQLRAAEQRLAVLASGSANNTKLADLVVAQFPRDSGITLVERNELERLINEKSLQQMLGDAAERRRVGQLVRADFLLVLSDARVNDSPLAAMLVETRSGARLSRWTWTADGTNDVAQALIVFTRSTLERFSSGVKSVIGVPPFLSKALVHDFDPWQSSFAHLLASALESQPGIAVIELEEADAIARELATTGGEISRVVPLLVRGEFTVPPDGPLTNRPLNVSVEISDGAKRLDTFTSGSLSSAAAGAWITTNVATRVLSFVQRGAVTPLTIADQHRALRTRANEFASVGVFQESIALREAALLLAPDDAVEREKVIAEYIGVLTRRIPAQMYSRASAPTPRARVEALKDSATDVWRRANAHLDYLLINRQISLSNYYAFAEHLLWGPGPVRNEIGSRRTAFIEEARAHLLVVLPYMLRLMEENHRNSYLRGRLVHEWVSQPYNDPRRGSNDYHLLLKLLDVVPGDLEPISDIVYMVQRSPEAANTRDVGGELAFEEFLQRLTNSPITLNQIYGRFGSLYREEHRNRQKQVTPEMLDTAQVLQKDYRHWCSTNHIGSSTLLDDAISDMVSRMRRAMNVTSTRTYRPRAPQPEASMGRMRLEQIPYQLKRADGKTELWRGQDWAGSSGSYSVQHFYRANDALNVLLTSGAVLIERTAGVIEEVQREPKARFENAAFDGTHVWVASYHGGLWLLDTNGQKISVIDQSAGLPPAEKGMLVHAVSPSRVFVAGAFGAHERSWIAQIEWSASVTNIRVFHSATLVNSAMPARRNSRDADHAFEPAWFVTAEDENSARHKVLLGCARERRALEIDIQSLAVKAFAWPTFGDTRDRQAYLPRRGHIFRAYDFDVVDYNLAHPNEKPRVFCVPKNKEGVSNGGLARTLLNPGDGWIYVPGLMWFRFDPTTGREERLSPERLPSPAKDQDHFAMAAFHGMIGWSYRGPFYKFWVEDSPSARAGKIDER